MNMLKTITPIDNSIYVKRDYASADNIENTINLSMKFYPQWKKINWIECRRFCKENGINWSWGDINI